MVKCKPRDFDPAINGTEREDAGGMFRVRAKFLRRDRA